MYIYREINGCKFVFLVMYIDDILFATNNLNILHKTVDFLSKKNKIKDIGETSFVVEI